MSIIRSDFYELSAPKVLHLRPENLDLDNSLPDEIVAKTIYTAISPGTELGAYTGASSLRPGNFYPRVSGYCNVARVLVIGSEVKNIKPDDLIVTLQSHRSAFKMKHDAMFVKIGEEIDLKLASTAYLFHLGYHSLLTANTQKQDRVAVVGAGVLGYTTALMAGVVGAETVVFTNQTEIEQKLLRDGIKVASKQEPINENEFEVVINTSNTWSDWLLALKLVKGSGVIVNLGFPGRGEDLPRFNPLDPRYTYFKNLTIKALCLLNDEQKKNNLQYLLNLIGSGKIDPNRIISAQIDHKNLREQYEEYLKRIVPMFTTILNWE